MMTDESKDWKRIVNTALYCEGFKITTEPLPSQPVLLRWKDGEHYLAIVYDITPLATAEHPNLYLYGGKTTQKLPSHWVENISEHPDVPYFHIPPDQNPHLGDILKRRGFILNKPNHELPPDLERKISAAFNFQ